MMTMTLLLALSVQQLPEPFETPWNRAIPSVVERPDGALPVAPAGFEVGIFAEDLSDPRRMELAPNGDLFVAESRSGTVVVLWDEDGDGVAEGRQTFASGLDRPFGLAFHQGYLSVGRGSPGGRPSTWWICRPAVTPSIPTPPSAWAST